MIEGLKIGGILASGADLIAKLLNAYRSNDQVAMANAIATFLAIAAAGALVSGLGFFPAFAIVFVFDIALNEAGGVVGVVRLSVEGVDRIISDLKRAGNDFKRVISDPYRAFGYLR